MTQRSFLKTAFAGALILAVGAPLQGQDPLPRPTQEQNDYAFRPDRGAGMTVPVRIDGRGPYQFVVDTGAERTVISGELARELKLSQGKSTRLHSMSEVANVQTVVIPMLQVNSSTVTGINAPALAQLDLGAPGLLGVDSLASRRVLFDFKKETMTVSPARRAPEPRAAPAPSLSVRSESLAG